MVGVKKWYKMSHCGAIVETTSNNVQLTCLIFSFGPVSPVFEYDGKSFPKWIQFLDLDKNRKDWYGARLLFHEFPLALATRDHMTKFATQGPRDGSRLSSSLFQKNS